MSAELKFNNAAINNQLAQVAKLMGRNGGTYVRTTSRRLIKKLAFEAPIDTGRLRAGFWPAASALSITNIYTRYPNKNEGQGIDKTKTQSPAFTIVNRVPYVLRLKRGPGWIRAAEAAIRARMVQDLRKYVQESWRRKKLIEELSPR